MHDGALTDHDLNPIFEYAANGQRCEKEGAWQAAVVWYERSLACLPKMFGGHQKIRTPGGPDMASASFTPGHASRIYTALGRSLMALGRLDDCRLANGAAAGLDPQNPALQTRDQTNDSLEGSCECDLSASSAPEKPVPGTAGNFKTDLSASLTLLMVTHCTHRLKRFQSLSPPSCKLVTATFGSLQEVFGPDIDTCPKILCFDAGTGPAECNSNYARNLERFSHRQGFELAVFDGVGLFNVLNQIVARIHTPYLFLVEHDWLFRSTPLHLGALVEMMNAAPQIHALRFNKRENRIDGNDFLLNIHATREPYALLRTASFSNNPSIIRTDKLRQQWLPMCSSALQRIADKLGGSAFGVEEILSRHYAADIRAQGFDKAHALWGTYIVGRAGDAPRVMHLGE